MMFINDIFVPYRDTAPLDDLKQLANATAGQFVYVSDKDGVRGLLDALNVALKLAQLQVYHLRTVILHKPMRGIAGHSLN
jgi:hypothetical protein